ncbi:MAG: domain type, partial [Acidobacteriaceae bacterium]|nr:domain type [Acidobacteriaceae bacterium]
KNAGTGKTVSETGAHLAGPDAANYQLTIRNGIANINPAPVTVSILPATRLTGAPNPAFLATYNGQSPAGVDVPALLSSISFQTNATSASAAGTYPVTGTSGYPNVDLTILPGILTVTLAFANTPRVDPALVTAKQVAAPPPPVSAISLILSPNSQGIFQINYSTDWSVFSGSGGGRPTALALSSFLPETPSGETYQGGIRPW